MAPNLPTRTRQPISNRSGYNGPDGPCADLIECECIGVTRDDEGMPTHLLFDNPQGGPPISIALGGGDGPNTVVMNLEDLPDGVTFADPDNPTDEELEALLLVLAEEAGPGGLVVFGDPPNQWVWYVDGSGSVEAIKCPPNPVVVLDPASPPDGVTFADPDNPTAEELAAAAAALLDGAPAGSLVVFGDLPNQWVWHVDSAGNVTPIKCPPNPVAVIDPASPPDGVTFADPDNPTPDELAAAAAALLDGAPAGSKAKYGDEPCQWIYEVDSAGTVCLLERPTGGYYCVTAQASGPDNVAAVDVSSGDVATPVVCMRIENDGCKPYEAFLHGDLHVDHSNFQGSGSLNNLFGLYGQYSVDGGSTWKTISHKLHGGGELYNRDDVSDTFAKETVPVGGLEVCLRAIYIGNPPAISDHNLKRPAWRCTVWGGHSA